MNAFHNTLYKISLTPCLSGSLSKSQVLISGDFSQCVLDVGFVVGSQRIVDRRVRLAGHIADAFDRVCQLKPR